MHVLDAMQKSERKVAVRDDKQNWYKRYPDGRVVKYNKFTSAVTPISSEMQEGFSDWRPVEEVLNHAKRICA